MRSRYMCRMRLWLALGCFTVLGSVCAKHTPPLSDAGDDAVVAENAVVTLHGVGADPDGGPVTFSWKQISGTPVVLSNSSSASPTFTAPITPGMLTFQFKVTDHEKDWTVDEVTITVQNQLPVVNAGADQTVTAGSAVVVYGAGNDPEGGTVTFHWTQLEGNPSVELTNPDTPTLSFNAPFFGTILKFRLQVTDTLQGSSFDDVVVTVSSIPASPSKLFVVNAVGNSVVSFNDASGLTGDVVPNRTVAGVNTLLNTPSDVVVSWGGSLLVTNGNPASFSITGYSSAGLANGNIIPNQVVQGSNTKLTAQPACMAVDTLNDVLFVARAGASPAILVYTGISDPSFTGNKNPTHTFSTAGKLTSPFGMCLNTNADLLYVADHDTNSVLVYQNPTTLDDEAPVLHTITGNPNFSGLYDVFVDSGDRLYVVSSSGPPRVDIFSGAAALDGPSAAPSTLTVPGAGDLTSIAVDASLHGYLLDHAAARIYIYEGIASAGGNTPPTHTISGSNTKLNQPIRLFLLEQ